MTQSTTLLSVCVCLKMGFLDSRCIGVAINTTNSGVKLIRMVKTEIHTSSTSIIIFSLLTNSNILLAVGTRRVDGNCRLEFKKCYEISHSSDIEALCS